MGLIEIDPKKCKRDGLCVKICCENHVFAEGEDGVPRIVNEKDCIACGHCVSVCPADAIRHGGMDMSGFVPVERESLPGPESVAALLSSLRSIRHYKDKPIPDDVLEKLLLAGSQAASEHNAQDRGFVVVKDKAKIAELATELAKHYKSLLPMMNRAVFGMISIFNPGLGAYLARSETDMRRVVKEYAPGNDTIFHGSPCVIVITSGKGNVLGKDSALTSQEAIRILGHSMGLGACVSGYATGAGSVVRKTLGIPRDMQVQTVFSLGYPKYEFRKAPPRKPAIVR